MNQNTKFSKTLNVCGLESKAKDISQKCDKKKSSFHDSCCRTKASSIPCDLKSGQGQKRKLINNVCTKDCFNDLYQRFTESPLELCCTIPEHSEHKILK